MVQERPLPTPTLATDPTGVEEDQSRSSTELCDGDSSMTSAILVADDVEAQQDESPGFQYEEEFLSNHLVIIKRWQEKEKLS